MNKFEYKSWDLHDAIDGLIAYDLGCTDSGIKDELLKEAVKKYFLNLNEKELRIETGKYAKKYLTDESLEAGYGMEDLIEFTNWLNREILN